VCRLRHQSGGKTAVRPSVCPMPLAQNGAFKAVITIEHIGKLNPPVRMVVYGRPEDLVAKTSSLRLKNSPRQYHDQAR